MSRVFVAVNEQGKRIAIKIARSDNPTYTNFLKEEVAQLRKTRHPNVVHIYPISLVPQQHVVYIARGTNLAPRFGGDAPWYYAMEMIEGGSMFAHRDNLLRFPIDWRIELAYQIALGIHYLHSEGIAHRDVKPDNVVFRHQPNPVQIERPDPVLVDFGIASRHNEDPLIFSGTLRYAAPEVVERLTGMKAHYRTTQTAQVDHCPADIWAFGVVIYELLTGRHPFEPFQNDDNLAEKILHSIPSPMPGVHESIQRLVLGDPNQKDTFGGLRGGMLSKVREDRPDIGFVVQHLDTETLYLPPRY
ncbi:MAG: serine/threonine protein kinase [Anaerolineaceae bacterium]|nr:serine/threonine protein kinase [Anaerolineaceae bacterium]